MKNDFQSFNFHSIIIGVGSKYFRYIIMFLNKISKEKFLWNSIYFLTLHALHIMPITNLAQINMNLNEYDRVDLKNVRA